MTESIVQRPLLGIGQDGIRFRGFFEPVFGGFVPGIAIRVVFHRQLAIGAFDFDVGRRSLNPENFVIVPLAHAFATFTMAGLRSRSPII